MSHVAGLELDVRDMVVPRLLERRAVELPDTPIVHLPTGSISSRRLDERSGRLAAWLAGEGVDRGQRVGLLLANDEPFLTVYFALGKRGAVAVPINPTYRGYMLEHVLADTACALLFADASIVEDLRPALASLAVRPRLVVVGDGAGAEQDDQLDEHFDELFDGAAIGTSPDVTFTDINCVIYTSGTTGPSKGVPITNAHAVHKALEVNVVCQMKPGDVIYSPLPLFHSMALRRGVLAAIVGGGECVLRDRFSASSYWDDVRRYRATIGHSVFTIPQILKKSAPSPDDRDHSLRVLYQGRYDPEFEERFGVKLIEGYGLTEAGVAMYVRADEPPRPGSCGRISDEWEVKIVDDDDLEVAPCEVGEIVLRPKLPWLVTPGYLNRPEATAAAWRNLWFHTGDLGSVDGDGYYYFRDRKKDAMRRRGENVSSWELEQVVRELPSVDEVAATPFPSPVGEDEIRVFVSLIPGCSLTGADVVAHCERRLPSFMVPRYVEIIDAVPKTPTGRIQKFDLRERPLGTGHHDAGDRSESARRQRAAAETGP